MRQAIQNAFGAGVGVGVGSIAVMVLSAFRRSWGQVEAIAPALPDIPVALTAAKNAVVEFSDLSNWQAVMLCKFQHIVFYIRT